MAKKMVVETFDDISGERIDTNLVPNPTVTFAIDGIEYEIELGAKNQSKLYAHLEPYAKAARKVGGRRGGGRGAGAATTSSGLTKAEIIKIRDWAQGAGHKVSSRGRLSKDVVEAYQNANA
jgi:hypothetical protein